MVYIRSSLSSSSPGIVTWTSDRHPVIYKLTSLPQNLRSLRVLQTLRLGQNEFETLPHDIGHLSLLKDLDLHSNNLCYLPFTLQGLRKLKYLNAANNRFDQVPLPVSKIHSLKVLNFSGNKLQSLAPDLESLTNLRELNLSYNKFESVPTAILSLSELKYLNLAGNHLKHVSTLNDLRFWGRLVSLLWVRSSNTSWVRLVIVSGRCVKRLLATRRIFKVRILANEVGRSSSALWDRLRTSRREK
jgi:Leucine-rich repeat (LRR) protein